MRLTRPRTLIRSAGLTVAVGLAAALGGCGGASSSSQPGARRSASTSVKAGAVQATGVLSACPIRPDTCNDGPRTSGGSITWLVEQDWGETWNPMRAEGSSYYLAEALAGTQPETGDFGPDGRWVWNRDLLAATPAVVREDPLTIVFRIRPRAVWSDGAPIGLDDFLYAWFQNSGRADQCRGCEPVSTTGWADLQSITGTDGGRTVTVTFKPHVADPEWYAQLAPSVEPAHLATRAGFDWHTPQGMGASSAYFARTVPTWSGGPYEISHAVPGQQVVMIPNPRWYGATKPSLARIVKQSIADSSSWAPALDNGELGGGAPAAFDPDVYAAIRGTQGVSTSISPDGAGWEQVHFNLHSSAVQSLALRRAIFTALNTADARQRLFGQVDPALRTDYFFSDHSPYHADLLAGTGFGSGDDAAARTILHAAGYSGDEPGASLTHDGHPVPALRFAYIAGNTERATYVELAQAYLRPLGIRVTPDAVPAAEFGQVLGTHDFDLVIYALSAGPLFTAAPGEYFGRTSAVNFGGLADSHVDALIARLAGEQTLPAAASDANAIGRAVVGDAYMLPLWEDPSYTFVSNRYVGVRNDTSSFVGAEYDLADWGVAAH